MKQKYLLIMGLLITFAASAVAQTKKQDKLSLKWFTSIAEAQKLSNETKKPIFAFFTGSDWCGWCHKLQRNVFDKKKFVDWAKKHVILLELDYPRNKKLTPELQQQNAELQQVFSIPGYPTIWLFFLTDDTINKKKNIEPLGSLGYPAVSEVGNEEIAFLHTADSILNAKKK